ncbi:hypothetical protein L9F63_019428 [Diploptera punctata]|uniref:Serine/threonine-protein phosphatase n=1 Tax=Diploptera punctata TaxID=6984 RepID=A0AAD8EED0_DIPPU|nr:hypothetical protein L9F63_019428 [Diploptera punctata]
MFKSVTDLCDIVSALVCCSDDNTYLFLPAEDGTNDLSIPSAKVRSDGWNMGIKRMLKEKFNFDTNNTETVLKIHRIWNPTNSAFLNHAVMKITISLDKKKNIKPTAKAKGKIKWMTERDTIECINSGKLKSPELIDYISALKGKMLNTLPTSSQSWPVVINYKPLGKLTEVAELHLTVKTDQIGAVPLSPQEQLTKAAGFEKNEQILLLQHFILLCYPYMYMSRKTFYTLLVQIGWVKDDIPELFRAADIFGQNGLSFRDYIFFMAAVEPSTLQGGAAAEVRLHYMFRYFDKNSDGRIDYNEIKLLLQMIRKSRNLPTDQASAAKEIEVTAKNINLEKSGTISLNEFVRAIIDQKIKGTSVILRSPKSILIHIKELKDAFPSKKIQDSSAKKDQDTERQLASAIDSVPGQIDYELAIHTIKLKRTGGVLSIEKTWSMDSAAGEPHSISDKTEFSRLMSIDSFKTKTPHSELLAGIHYYCSSISTAEASRKGGKGKDAFSWGQVNLSAFGNMLLQVSAKAAEICRSESRLLELQTPVYVLGDIHGNLPDLIIFEKVLWSLGPNLTPCTILFLGDYVDRGPHGVEVVGYIFAHKVQNPTKVKLLRGNHEIRDIQQKFTFFNECKSKFGENLGNQIWNRVNDVFDNLPLSATIDGKIFCCHGGIPPPWLCPVVSAIKAIPCPLVNPDQESYLAWELMWNDPVRMEKMPNSLIQELKANEGFAANTRRGTAHVFNDEALQRFLTVNGFSHVIRAHETQQAGFQVQQKGKLVTVFSSSGYCGGKNEAACVLAYLGKLRMFRINTAV